MEIRNFDETFDTAIFSDIYNQMTTHFDPEAPYKLTNNWFSTVMKTYDRTDFNKDALLAIDDSGTVKGYAILLKSSNFERWYIQLDVTPDQISTTLPGELFDKILEIARKQKPPEILLAHHENFKVLAEKLLDVGFQPVLSTWTVRHTDTNSILETKIPSDITIRPQKGDEELKTCIDLRNEQYKDAIGLEKATVERTKRMNALFKREEEWERFVALEDENVVGFAIVQRSNKPDQKHFGTINMLAVPPSHQNRGIGSALMTTGMKKLKEMGCTVIDSTEGEDFPEAKKFFKKFGFVDQERNEFVYYSIK